MRITEFRDKKGWSQTLLAEKSGVSQTYISELAVMLIALNNPLIYSC
jgi:predicted transcriptional regulator